MLGGKFFPFDLLDSFSYGYALSYDAIVINIILDIFIDMASLIAHFLREKPDDLLIVLGEALDRVSLPR